MKWYYKYIIGLLVLSGASGAWAAELSVPFLRSHILPADSTQVLSVYNETDRVLTYELNLFPLWQWTASGTTLEEMQWMRLPHEMVVVGAGKEVQIPYEISVDDVAIEGLAGFLLEFSGVRERGKIPERQHTLFVLSSEMHNEEKHTLQVFSESLSQYVKTMWKQVRLLM